ncbi:MAG: FAD-dependent oxidoreductase [Acholeplasmatales bacterium]|nr:MAG: FAD-dependent oxidoreductase [Acholeplasmatales bacterium]
MKTDLLVIGGGAAGIAAALEASAQGLEVLLLERDTQLGGILNQCIHNGFGLHVFKEELTGPEYAERFIHMFHDKDIAYKLNTTVLDIRKEDAGFVVSASSLQEGWLELECRAIMLASGCYERTRGQIQLPGDRPKGVMPAGSAQRYLNMDGYLVGKDVFILGSGDIGLIMARRMKLEGANVHGVAEIMPHSNGLTRNIVQCLHDYDIPLFLSHTVTDIRGKDRLEGVTIQQVDENWKPISGTDKHFSVDTLLLSVGLVPDTMVFESLDIAMHPVTKGAVVDQHYQTSIPGIFACGNALHVHDLVDYVTEESRRAGRAAARYVKGLSVRQKRLALNSGANIHYTLPQYIDTADFNGVISCMFRVTKKAEQGEFVIRQGDRIIQRKKARFLAPAEMEQLDLDQTMLSDHETPLTLDFEVIRP